MDSQSIETMPDKDWVLLWLVTRPDSRNSGWVTGQKAQADEHDGMFWDGHIYRPLEWCTHWTPLPPPPAKGE